MVTIDKVITLIGDVGNKINFLDTVNANKYRSQLFIHFIFGRHCEIVDGFDVILLKCETFNQSVVRLEVGVFEGLRIESFQLQFSEEW